MTATPKGFCASFLVGPFKMCGLVFWFALEAPQNRGYRASKTIGTTPHHRETLSKVQKGDV